MAKFKDLFSGTIIEVTDKNRIKKLKGYPDKFEFIEEKTVEQAEEGTPISSEASVEQTEVSNNKESKKKFK